MQSPEAYNQAYSAGYNARKAEEGVEDFADVFGDVISTPLSVPLKDSNGEIIGRVQLIPDTGVMYGTINDVNVLKMLKGQIGAGLRGISFESIRSTPKE